MIEGDMVSPSAHTLGQSMGGIAPMMARDTAPSKEPSQLEQCSLVLAQNNELLSEVNRRLLNITDRLGNVAPLDAGESLSAEQATQPHGFDLLQKQLAANNRGATSALQLLEQIERYV